MTPRPRASLRSRSLADLVLPEIDPLVKRYGFAESGILLHWPEIVGARFAAHCRPIKLQWSGRGKPSDTADKQTATLVLRVESGFALALQHMTAVVIERVNGHLGWRCVGKVALKQGPLPVFAASGRKRPAPDPEAARRAAALVGPLGEKDLEAALIRLGGRVLGAKSPRSDRG